MRQTLNFNYTNMKFTKEQAVEALRAELTNKGRKTQHMSDRTLANLTEILIKKFANEETGLPDFVTDMLEIFNEVEGDARKKNSDFAKYKEAHPESEPPKDDPKDKDGNKTTPEFEALKAEIEALKAINAQNEKKSKLSAKKTELITALGNKGIKDEEWLNTFLSEVNITEDMDVEAKAESYAKLYNKTRANVPPTPTPGNPTGGGEDEYASLKAASELAKQRDEQFKIN